MTKEERKSYAFLREKGFKEVDLKGNMQDIAITMQEYADQQNKELLQELKRVTKKASVMEQDNFKLIEEIRILKIQMKRL